MQDMESLLKEDTSQEIKEHEVVQGIVEQVDHSEVLVSIGGKVDGMISRKELAYPIPEDAGEVVKKGDVIDVYVMSLNGENGAVLSKVKADKLAAWKNLDDNLDKNEPIEAKVVQVVKGGLVVSALGVRGFIPASRIELHFVKDLNVYVGKTLMVLPIEVNVKEHRLILSRRDILEKERKEKEEQIFQSLEIGQILDGRVKRIVEYGAFVDIGGVDGLVHVSDLSWDRVKSPFDILKVDDEIKVFVKNFDVEKRRISLSIKDTVPDPWFERASRYEQGSTIEGRINKLTDFGAFMEIEPNFDGLIPMGELRDPRPAKADEVVHTGDVVRVKIMQIDTNRKRISLSMTKAEA